MEPEKQHFEPAQRGGKIPIEPRPARQLRPSEADEDRHERIEYLRSIAPEQKPKRLWLRIVLVVLGVAVVAAAVYFLFFHGKASKTPSTATNHATTSTQQTGTTQTKHFDSPTLGLGLDYPENWKAAETNGKVTVTSTAMQLKPANGSTTNGQVVVTIQAKQSSLDAFKKGNGLAVINSERVSYTKPSQSQRAQTFLTFVQYAGSTGSGIDGIYITGDNGYQKDQAVPQTDIIQVDPLVTVNFLKCSDANCSGTGAPMTVASSTWGASGVAQTIRSLLTSLTIQ
jgi:hypothetical protein